MKSPRLCHRPAGRLRESALLGVLALGVALACGQEPGPPTAAMQEPEPREGELQPPSSPDEPILELSYEGGQIANPDTTPHVRVFADGRVLVHYPDYMKRAGDYELRLSSAELEQLLSSFRDESVLTLDDEQIRAMESEVRRGRPDLEMPVDHGTEAVVHIRAESFTPTGREGPSLLGIDQRIEIPSQTLRVAREAGPSRLSRLAAGISALEELADREDLEPTRDGGGAP